MASSLSTLVVALVEQTGRQTTPQTNRRLAQDGMGMGQR